MQASFLRSLAVLCSFARGSFLGRSDVQNVTGPGFCNFTSSMGPFGLPRTVEVFPENVVFQSGNVLVVGHEDLRFMIFARHGSHGRPICEEQARVLCGSAPDVAATFLELGRGACVSRSRCNAGPPQLSYARTMIGGAFRFGQTRFKRVAVLGLGAGSLPFWFAHHLQHADVDAVDIDGDVIAAAPCFGLASSPRLRLVHADGRKYLESQRSASLDVLLVDVFDDTDIPLCLRTVEFFELAFEKLAPGGILVMNTWKQQVASVRLAISTAFPGRTVFVGNSPGLGNLVLLVRRGGLVNGTAMKDVGDSAKWARDAKFSERTDFLSEKTGGGHHGPLRDVSACPRF